MLEQDEQSGRTTGRLEYTWPTTAYAIGGTQRWHYDTLSSPHQPPNPFTISDDYGPPGAVGAWAPPPHPPGPQDLSRDYGPDGAAGGLSRSTPRQVDDTTTRPSGSGPTRQSDDRDSEPDCLLRPTRHGPGSSDLIVFGQCAIVFGQSVCAEPPAATAH